MCTIKPQSYEVLFLRQRVRQTNFFVLLGQFLPFYPSNKPENEKIEEMKNAYEAVIILYMCTKNHDHMVYTSWDMGATHNFLSFRVIFYPFTPLLAPGIKNWKKKRYFLFCMCTINKDSSDIRLNRQKFLSFWVIFCPFIPLTNQKIKI